jgi:hypothetical protein
LSGIDLHAQLSDQSHLHQSSLDTDILAIVSTNSKFIYTTEKVMEKFTTYIPGAKIDDKNILTCNSISALHMEDILIMLLSVPCIIMRKSYLRMRFKINDNIVVSPKSSGLIWKEKDDSNMCESIIRTMPNVAGMKGMIVLHHIIQSLIYIQLLGLSISVFFSMHIFSYLTGIGGNQE